MGVSLLIHSIGLFLYKGANLKPTTITLDLSLDAFYTGLISNRLLKDCDIKMPNCFQTQFVSLTLYETPIVFTRAYVLLQNSLAYSFGEIKKIDYLMFAS